MFLQFNAVIQHLDVLVLIFVSWMHLTNPIVEDILQRLDIIFVDESLLYVQSYRTCFLQCFCCGDACGIALVVLLQTVLILS